MGRGQGLRAGVEERRRYRADAEAGGMGRRDVRLVQCGGPASLCGQRVAGRPVITRVEIKITRRVHAIDATPARWRGDAGSLCTRLTG
jgi:hypothetical protein